MACQRCSNYIFILNLMPGFNWLDIGNWKARRETFQFWDLVQLALEILRYMCMSPGFNDITYSYLYLLLELCHIISLKGHFHELWMK